MSIQHAMNIAGFCPAIMTLPKPGHTVTRVDWRGCMATERHVEDTGDLLRFEDRKLYGGRGPTRGVVVQYDKLGERWEPLDHLRIVNGNAEIWP